MPEPKLKPCPFCGGAVVLDYYGGTDGPNAPATISCNECCLDMTLRGRAKAVRRWNTRKGERDA